jgi:hypothetical protein
MLFGLYMHHSKLSLCLCMCHLPSVFMSNFLLLIRTPVIKLGLTVIQCHFILSSSARLCFQIRSYSEILGIRIVTCLLRGYNETFDKWQKGMFHLCIWSEKGPLGLWILELFLLTL